MHATQVVCSSSMKQHYMCVHEAKLHVHVAAHACGNHMIHIHCEFIFELYCIAMIICLGRFVLHSTAILYDTEDSFEQLLATSYWLSPSYGNNTAEKFLL